MKTPNIETSAKDALREDLPLDTQISYSNGLLTFRFSSVKELEGARLREVWQRHSDAIVDVCQTIEGVEQVQLRCGELSYPAFLPAKYAVFARFYKWASR